MASPEQVKAKRDRRSRLIRKSFRGIGESDIVGYFPHQRVPDRLSIREHKVDNGSGPIIYTVKTDTPLQNVVEIGTEMNSLDMGFDYVVASVNKRTGETKFKPARMFKFEGRYTEDPAVTLGIKAHPPADYSANHAISSTSWSERRHELTQEFGSSMKRKIQEAATRRSVNASVLDEMVKTSFASETVIKNREQAKLEDITMVQNAESSILPPAVQAEIPKNIYPLKMFISEEEVEQMTEGSEASIKTGKVQLLQNGWPEVLFKTCPDYAGYTGINAVAFEMLACQTYTLGIMSKNKSILKKDLDEYPFDAAILEKVQLEYMPKEFDRGSSGKAMPRLFFKTEEKERLAAWTLALAITLSPGCAIPVSPWQDSINMPPKSVEKLLIGLGCTLGHCSTEEAIATGSIQSARLLRPPQLEKKGPKKMRR